MNRWYLLVAGCVLFCGYGQLCAENNSFSFHEMTVPLEGRKSCQLKFVRFDSSYYDLRIVSNGSDFSQPVYGTLEGALKQNGCVAGTNGGFFDIDPFSNVGYLVVGSKVLAKRPDKPWMHGLILLERGKLQLGDMEELYPPAEPQMALQSGPCLIKEGKPKVEGSGGQRAWRTFIGRDAGYQWILGISSPVSLKELSEALKVPEVHTVVELNYVLNLDGGPSTGLFVEQDGEVVFKREPSRVQNYIGILPRKKAPEINKNK